MSDEFTSATTTIDASADAVFEVLADPSQRATIDGTGWVCGSLDDRPVSQSGQVFRMTMYHENHPDGHYEICNLVLDFEPSRAISWKPGYVSKESGELEFGGWIWRYDLTALDPSRTRATHTYDWSEVGPGPREYLEFPPFAPDHLDNSLANLAAIVTR